MGALTDQTEYAIDAAESSGPVIFVVGPTAGGKSVLALGLAEQTGGVVINADSMQVYRNLKILTARPTVADECHAPHRLYGFLDADAGYSVAQWAAQANEEIAAAHAADAVPIVVGGTGLYVRGLIEGLAPVPDIPNTIRAETRALHAKLGGPAFKAALAARDPNGAARLPAGDGQRLMRAWEVLEATGRPLREWQALAPAAPLANPYYVVLVQPERDVLYERCDRRFEDMIGAGVLAEVEALDRLDLPSDRPITRALGVPALTRHVRGEISLDAAGEEAKRETRRYAKRQTTWFRHQLRADLVLNGAADDGRHLTAAAARFLLTVGWQANSVAAF